MVLEGELTVGSRFQHWSRKSQEQSLVPIVFSNDNINPDCCIEMADQKEMKKRLKALMQRPENQVCSDCPQPKPLWASLIVPPPGAPENSLPIGAFCCLECSGSHRRLGVHISFVRSINLDSCKS